LQSKGVLLPKEDFAKNKHAFLVRIDYFITEKAGEANAKINNKEEMPLLYASKINDLQMMELLINKDADVFVKDCKKTALHLTNDLEAMKLLIEKFKI
jgi:ankyrin repeat protein